MNIDLINTLKKTLNFTVSTSQYIAYEDMLYGEHNHPTPMHTPTGGSVATSGQRWAVLLQFLNTYLNFKKKFELTNYRLYLPGFIIYLLPYSANILSHVKKGNLLNGDFFKK